MMERERLADGAAHRGAHHMSRRDPQCVQETDRVLRHVAQQIGSPDRLACRSRYQSARHVWHAGRVEAGRQSGVAVVEADHVIAARGELGAELRRPMQSSARPSP